MTAARPSERRLEQRALLELVLAAVCFGAMAFAAKLATAHLSGGQVAAVRFAIGLLPFVLVPSLLLRAARIDRLDLIVYRGLFGGIAVVLYFLAIEHIPVGIATLFNYSSPLWSGLFAAWFLGEPLRRATFIPLLVALSGVALVASTTLTPGQGFVVNRYTVYGLASAVFAGAALTAIRASRRTENSWAIFASFGVLGLLSTLPVAIPNWRTPTRFDLWALAACGLFALAAQLLMTHAYRFIDNVRAGAISQLAVFITMLLGVYALGDTMTPRAVFGSVLTVGGVIASLALGRTRPAGEATPDDEPRTTPSDQGIGTRISQPG